MHKGENVTSGISKHDQNYLILIIRFKPIKHSEVNNNGFLTRFELYEMFVPLCNY